MTAEKHLVHVFSTFAAGGPQVRTSQILPKLPPHYRHTIIAMDGNQECRERIPASLPVQYLDPPPKSPSWQAPLRLASFLKSLSPDLLLTYNWGAIESVLAGRLAGIRASIHAEDGFGPEETVKQKGRRVWARRVLLRWVSKVVVPSHRLYDIARSSWKLGEPRVELIPNGIDTDRFQAGESSVRPQLGIPEDAFVIGTVAKLRKEKALDLLIHAFAKLEESSGVHLLIVGDGSEREGWTALAHELGVASRVHLPGQIPDPSDAYRAMDVCALSSITEQMPISVVEAMASRLPLVSTDVGDISRMVAEGNRCFVLPDRNVDGYANALRDLFQHPEKRQVLGQANRDKCLQEYRDVTMLERYHGIYATALGE